MENRKRKRSDILLFEEGEIWVKNNGWWPAKILSDSEISDDMQRLKPSKSTTVVYPVFIFGKHTFIWILQSDCSVTAPKDRNKLNHSAGYDIALQELDDKEQWKTLISRYISLLVAPNYPTIKKAHKPRVIDPKLLKQYDHGSVIWARMSSWPHWPALVINESDIPAHVPLKTPKDPHLHHCVRFFGEDTYAWIHLRSILPYTMELEEVKKVNVKKHLWRYTTPLFEIATAEVHDYVNNRDSKVDVQNASVELCVPDQLDTPDDKFSEDLKISVVEEENIEAPSPVDLQSINDIPSHQTLETDDQEVDEIQSNVANDLPDTNLVQPTEDVTLDTKLTIPVESEADDLQVDIDSNMVNAENCDDMNVEEKGLSLAVEMNEIEVEVLPPEQNVNQCDVDPSDSGEPAVDTDIIDQPMIEITDQNTGASEVEADPLEIDANNKVYPIEKSDFLEDIQHDIKSQISSSITISNVMFFAGDDGNSDDDIFATTDED